MTHLYLPKSGFLLLGACALLSIPLTVLGDTYGDFSYTTSGSNAKITGYTGTGGVVSIPGTISNLTVTSIGDSAFYSCAGLTSVTIPNSVTNIGDRAIGNCSGLTSIDVASDNPTYSSLDGVLLNKAQTTLIQFPAGRTGTYQTPNSVTTIGDYAFYRSGLGSVVIGNSVTGMGREAFRQSLGLTNATIGTGVTNIGHYAFYSCDSLTSVTIPDSVKSIEGSAFAECDTLRSVAIGNGVLTLGTRAFYNCTRLAELRIGTNVTSIGDSAFYRCQGLTTVTIPGSGTSVGSHAFDACTGLTNVVISNGVVSLGAYAFHYCASLPKVTLPSNVVSIAGNVFSYCISLTEIAVDPANPNYCSADGVLFDKAGALLITFPGAKTSPYTIPESVVSIGDAAFRTCLGLRAMTIPEGITSLGTMAFYDCTNLTAALISSSVTNIGIDAFTYCRSLTRIDVAPSNASYCSVEGVLFDKAMTTLIVSPAGRTGAGWIPDSVTRIMDSAVAYSYGLTSMTMGRGLTNIGAAAFQNCIGLRNMYFKGGAPTLGVNALVNCSGLTLYYLPTATNGWTSSLGGRPALLWNPTCSTIREAAGVVSCTVTGTPTIPVAWEATSNVTAALWWRLQTTNLVGGTFEFSDPEATNAPARFYRVVGQ